MDKFKELRTRATTLQARAVKAEEQAALLRTTLAEKEAKVAQLEERLQLTREAVRTITSLATIQAKLRQNQTRISTAESKGAQYESKYNQILEDRDEFERKTEETVIKLRAFEAEVQSIIGVEPQPEPVKLSVRSSRFGPTIRSSRKI